MKKLFLSSCELLWNNAASLMTQATVEDVFFWECPPLFAFKKYNQETHMFILLKPL